MRLRSLIRINPGRSTVMHLSPSTEVTFAPMEALADGIGGLDTSIIKTLGEVKDGSYSFFSDGDVLLAKVTPCFENGKKAIANGLMNGIGFATSEVHIVRPDIRKLDRNYLRFLFSSEIFRAAGIASMTGAGGLKRVSEDAIRNFPLPIRDTDVQKKIAAFLDRETARIDKLIEQKTTQANLLCQRKCVRIATLLTKGNNPHVPVKESGIHWLSKIPAHWTLKRLRYICTIKTGERDTEERIDEGEYPFFVRSDHIERINSYSLDCEAVLTSGDGAGVARVFHYYKGKFDFHQLRCSPKTQPV